MLEVPTTQAKAPSTTTNPYAGLRDISEVAPYDEIKDKPLFDEIREVLRKHKAIDRFGIAHLHGHFKVNEGEVMVETHDEQKRTLTIKPYRNQNLKEPNTELQPTNWRFGEDGRVIEMQFCIETAGGHIEML